MGAMINEDRFGVVQATLDVASVAANTTAAQTFTIPGLKVGDFVAVNKPSLSAGLSVAGARVSAPDTLSLTFGNHTGSPIDPTAETYLVFWFRAEKTPTTVGN